MKVWPFVLTLVAAVTLGPGPVRAACPFGPLQCKSGFVWRDAYPGDHVCVTGAQRSQAAADNRSALVQATTRRTGPGPCKAGLKPRNAGPSDTVCVSAAVRAEIARQNRAGPQRIDPICLSEITSLNLHTERLVAALTSPPAKGDFTVTRISSSGQIFGQSQAPLAIATDRMWNPGTTLTVNVTGASPALVARIERFASQWSKWANIRFRFVADPMQATIRVIVTASGQSKSLVGRDTLGTAAPAHTMELGWLTDTTSDNEVSRVVLHEFGHALGLIHEQSSPAAGIPWDRDKVFAYYRAHDHWSDDEITRNVLAVASLSTTNFSQFDPASIMEYPVDAALTTNGYSVGWNDTLSAIDKQFIALWYPFPPGTLGSFGTGDDCDLIAFDVANGVPGEVGLRFVLRVAPTIWWKSIRVPVQGGGFVEIEADANSAGDTTIATADIDASRPIGFSKAKLFGVHTPLGFTWNVMPAFASGTRVILDWNRDRCS